MGNELAVAATRVRVSLVTDTSAPMVGEPLFGTLVVENVGNSPVEIEYAWMGRNELGRPNNYEVSAVSAGGAAVAVPDSGPEFGGQSWRVTIAPRAERRTRLLLSLWAPFERPDRYTITLRTTVPARDASSDAGTAQNVTLSASAVVDVRPQNDADFAALIAGLESRAANNDEDAQRAIVWIRDVRVIESLARLSTRVPSASWGSYIFALGRFNDDRALAAIERVLRITAADLDPAGYTTAELREMAAQSLRYTAVSALDRSPHPRAPSMVLAMRNDPNDSIRLTVLHRVARLPRAQSEPVIRSMLNDRYPLVRQEAERYLRELR